MFSSTSLVRYVSQPEAYTLAKPEGFLGEFAVDYNSYKVYFINYKINAMRYETTVDSYLSTSMGSGTNIVGFLNADDILINLERSVDSALHDMQMYVTNSRTSFLFVNDTRIDGEYRLGGVSYVDGLPDDGVIKPPGGESSMVRMLLGGYLGGGGNPYEVNFMSNRDVVVPAMLMLHNDKDARYDDDLLNAGLPLTKLDRFMKGYGTWMGNFSYTDIL